MGTHPVFQGTLIQVDTWIKDLTGPDFHMGVGLRGMGDAQILPLFQWGRF